MASPPEAEHPLAEKGILKMDCSRIKEYIYSFLDGELDDQNSLSVKEHLSTCPLCSLELEQEKKIDYLIRHNIPKEKAPYELKETILNQIKEFGEGKVNPFAHPFLKPILATSAIALLIIVLISSLLINFNKPFPVYSETVKEHIQFLQGSLPMYIVSKEPQDVSKWLQAKLDFKIMVPDLSSQNVDLLGARVCSLKNKKSAYITYEKDGHNISVFMFDAKNLKFPTARKMTMNNKHFYLNKEKGFNSALWIDEGIACVFVSNLGEAELLYLASL